MLKTTIAAGAIALLTGSALAADMPVYTKAPAPAPATPMWDVAFGGLVASDYYFRGISQSNRGPSAGAYFEFQYNGTFGQWYAGVAGYSINWPLLAPNGVDFGFTDPSAEIDFTFGWRKEWDKLSVDIGAIYYYYPKETHNGTTGNSDFWEIYWKGGYTVNDKLSVGANAFYTPDLLNYSESFATLNGTSTNARALYASLTGQYTFWEKGDWSGAISGELGHWWIKGAPFIAAGAGDPDYTYWNAGISWKYKAVTFDVRYHGTDQSRADCANFLLITTANKASRWCNDTVIATLKFDTSLSDLK